jgi:hypothetical protein
MGEIMSGVKKGWDVDRSLTCKKRLIKIFREIRYNRYYTHHNKYLEKGIQQEEDAITLISRKRKIDISKNKIRLENEFFTGEPDIILTVETVDAKCAWSLDTFPHESTYEIDSDYQYQGIGYNSLTGTKLHTVAYCLVNATPSLIESEKRSLWYRLGCPRKESEEYVLGALEVERNMIFDMAQFKRDWPDYELDSPLEWTFDVPFDERIIEFPIPFDDKIYEKMIARIVECREWMNRNLFKK